MAVALDATSQGTVSGAASLTISHTVGSGSDRYLLVMVVGTNSTDFLASGTCSYGGTSMGSAIVTKATGAANAYIYFWGMAAPTSGTANIVITPSASAYMDALAISFSGVDQSTPVASSAKWVGSQASPSPTLAITLPSNGLIADFFCARATSQTLTPGTNQTRAGTTIAGGVSTSSGSTNTAANDASWSAWSGSLSLAHAAVALNAAAAGDTTAPVLTSPTGTSTGSTTATVGATTDEGNGTMYAFVSTSGTAPAGSTLKAGTGAAWAGSVAVSSTGAKTLSATGLTASTTYYAHVIHTDAAANDSNIVTSASFTTSAVGDTTVPTLTGTITVGTVTSSSIQITWPAGSDNVAVTSYETSPDGTTWTDRGNVLTYTFTGLAASTSYTLRVRAKDAAGNVSTPALSVTQSTSAPPVYGFDLNASSYAFKREHDGALMASTALTFWASNASTGALVAQITGFSTNASGIVTSKVTHASLVNGTQYRLAWEFASGEYGVAKLTAA